ncbi:pseudouridine synthase [Halothiobacillus sp. DCM-1]|uniref:pseudouridine synthase n=1 Tax=Halothiobacillus sp. DCM-1 TaxID=3112558 RepID=UPI0032489F7D
MEKQRLHKVLATLGLGSRRQVEQWIAAGEVKRNGQIAAVGDLTEPGDTLEVRGQKIIVPDESPVRRVLIYHKPEGEITSASDPEGRPTVFGALPPIRQGRWITVGRLDFNTSGLLLATNDGELANRLMHPSYQIERTYAVRVLGGLTEDQIRQLTTEVMLEDGPARFDQLTDAGGTGINHWHHVTLREGRNREVRRMIEAVGGQVSRLIRISYAGISLPPRLKPGRAQDLAPEIEDALVKLVGLKPEHRRKVQDDDTRRRALKPYRARTPQGQLAPRENAPFYRSSGDSTENPPAAPRRTLKLKPGAAPEAPARRTASPARPPRPAQNSARTERDSAAKNTSNPRPAAYPERSPRADKPAAPRRPTNRRPGGTR